MGPVLTMGWAWTCNSAFEEILAQLDSAGNVMFILVVARSCTFSNFIYLFDFKKVISEA